MRREVMLGVGLGLGAGLGVLLYAYKTGRWPFRRVVPEVITPTPEVTAPAPAVQYPPSVPSPAPMVLRCEARKFRGAGTVSTLQVFTDKGYVGTIETRAPEGEAGTFSPFIFSIPAGSTWVMFKWLDCPSAVVLRKYPTVDGRQLTVPVEQKVYAETTEGWIIGGYDYIRFPL